MVFVLFNFIFNSLDNLAYMIVLASRLAAHQDMFNIGIVAGKVLVSISFWYFNGFLLYENVFDAII